MAFRTLCSPGSCSANSPGRLLPCRSRKRQPPSARGRPHRRASPLPSTQAERLHAAEGAGQDLAQGRALDARHQAGRGADDAASGATKARLDRGEVGIDVGVVVLEVADDGDVGQVVDELRAACRRTRCRIRRPRPRSAGRGRAGSCARSPRARRRSGTTDRGRRWSRRNAQQARGASSCRACRRHDQRRRGRG